MPRTKKPPGKDLLLKIANLRFKDGLKVPQMAAYLGIGQKQVKPLLEQSVRWLLDEQQRQDPAKHIDSAQESLRRSLGEKYPHLKDVVIVPGGAVKQEAQYRALIRQWGILAADYVDDLARHALVKGDDLYVCMSGGETILEAMNSLKERERSNVYFYASALIGRASHRDKKSHVDPAANATVAWARSGRLPRQCVYATVPPCYLTEDEKALPLQRRKLLIAKQLDRLAEMDPIKRHIKLHLGSEFDVAFAGLGLVKTPAGSPGRENRRTGTDLLEPLGITADELLAEGAIAELAYCFFDRNGEDSNDRWRFFLTAGHEDPNRCGLRFYRQMVNDKKHVIVMAGTYKVPAIVAALKGKLFNVWITDEEAARKVLAAK
jgi:DNA-binding transcriptional regulator LsrR (DeoR family)